MTAPFLGLVIPAYRERTRLPRSLPPVLRWLRAQPFSWEMRVVDDGSPDDTADVARTLAEGDSRVVVQREPHRGKGGAVRAGMLASPAEWRFLADADFSMPAEEIPRFLPPRLCGHDVIIGTREGPGASRVGEPESRHRVGRVFNAFIQAAILPGVQDSQCGFKCFSRHAAELLFPLQTIDGFAFDVEILYLARRFGLSVTEVPVPWWYMDTSQVRPFRDAQRMAREVARIRLNHMRGRYGSLPG